MNAFKHVNTLMFTTYLCAQFDLMTLCTVMYLIAAVSDPVETASMLFRRIAAQPQNIECAEPHHCLYIAQYKIKLVHSLHNAVKPEITGRTPPLYLSHYYHFDAQFDRPSILLLLYLTPGRVEGMPEYCHTRSVYLSCRTWCLLRETPSGGFLKQLLPSDELQCAERPNATLLNGMVRPSRPMCMSGSQH